MDRRTVLLGAMAAGISSLTRAQTPPPSVAGAASALLPQPIETIDLWPGGAPGMPAKPPQETVIERSKDPALNDRAVSGISRPRLAVFRPAIPNGAAVMITPGGGYQRIVIDKEGYELGRYLSARGLTVFVLFYRQAKDGWGAGPNVSLSDAQRAIRVIRARASDYGLDAEKIAAMGFSAGGHVCADLATRFATRTYDPTDEADKLSARPFVAAPIYPVISMTLPVAHAGSRENLVGANAGIELERSHSPLFNVPDNAPPCFLVHAEDDNVVSVENTLEFRAALVARRIPVELHLFSSGGHGFGLRNTLGKPVAVWPELFLTWGLEQGLI